MVLCSNLLLLLVLVYCFNGEYDSLNRTINTNCTPSQNCVKGDLIALNIADCVRTSYPFGRSCNSRNLACAVAENLKFKCGDPGTNTRCVCWNETGVDDMCRCQYWPENGPTSTSPSLSPSPSLSSSTSPSPSPSPTPSPYYCHNSSKQEQCGHICNQDEIFCWKRFECFKGCCVDNAAGKKESPTFCGDGSCNGNEHPDSCPIDCCYQVNSTCINDTRVCTPTCCQTQQCCSESTTGGSNGGNAGVIVGSVFGAVVVLIIITGLLVIILKCKHSSIERLPIFKKKYVHPISENDYY